MGEKAVSARDVGNDGYGVQFNALAYTSFSWVCLQYRLRSSVYNIYILPSEIIAPSSFVISILIIAVA